jgi:hypothetical protein
MNQANNTTFPCSCCNREFNDRDLFEVPGNKDELCDYCKEGRVCRVCLDLPCGFCKDVNKEKENGMC